MLENYEMEEIKATKEEQYVEALKRMEMLKLSDFTVETFKKGSLTVNCKFSNLEQTDFVVMARELTEEELAEVRKIEEEYGIKVFTTILSDTNVGELLDCLYVTQYKEEWEMDYDLMEDNLIMSYCINHDVPYFSEFGSIGIEKWNGGIYRTA